jgi:hypothetical protein
MELVTPPSAASRVSPLRVRHATLRRRVAHPRPCRLRTQRGCVFDALGPAPAIAPEAGRACAADTETPSSVIWIGSLANVVPPEPARGPHCRRGRIGSRDSVPREPHRPGDEYPNVLNLIIRPSRPARFSADRCGRGYRVADGSSSRPIRIRCSPASTRVRKALPAAFLSVNSCCVYKVGLILRSRSASTGASAE